MKGILTYTPKLFLQDVFPYEDHFEGMLQQKKNDHSYRYFRKVNRQAGTFPMGADYTHGGNMDDLKLRISHRFRSQIALL